MKQGQRRRNALSGKRRKKLLFLLALVLLLGSGAFLFQGERLAVLPEIITRLTQTKPDNLLPAVTAASSRGDIYDRNFRRLAATYETYALYARPLEMEDPDGAASQLAEILGLEPNKLLANLKGERGFVWVAKGIEQGLAEAVKERNIRGVYQVVETKRFYPNYETAAHAVGFVENGQGLDGIEFNYNSLLRGDEVNRAELEALRLNPEAQFSRAGTHLVLNLDLMIQNKIESFLEKRVKITGASSGAVLVMDANTGGILAMASYPSFNPNSYWEFPSSALNNHIVSEPVYPGELALIFQQAAAINLQNEQRVDEADNTEGSMPIPVIEPQITKRKKLSAAPVIASVDPGYLTHFATLLGLDQVPVSDIPLKDESVASADLALTDPDFHVSALRLLAGFTFLLNNGRTVAPHLLYQAYPRENPIPVELVLSGPEQSQALHPATTGDLVDFLAVKWLKMNSAKDAAQLPMFFEAHRFVNQSESYDQVKDGGSGTVLPEEPSRLRQSVMLGAIPGRNPKLTMIGVLAYPSSPETVSPATLESFGSKFTVLNPDHDLIQKMLYVADHPPLVPSPDFWKTDATILATGINHPAANAKNIPGLAENRKNMPDVTGKSLRAGLQVLQHYDLEVKIVGSGRIIKQHPAAGTEIKNNTVCLLEMHQEI